MGWVRDADGVATAGLPPVHLNFIFCPLNFGLFHNLFLNLFYQSHLSQSALRHARPLGRSSAYEFVPL